jgi:transcription antitermination factor NusG
MPSANFTITSAGAEPLEVLREPSWFAVYTASRHEKAVARHFDIRGVAHFLPTYQVRRKWKNGLKVELELPLFPGYIFANIQSYEHIKVLQAPGVLAIVSGTGGNYSPLPGAEIEALREGLKSRHAEPHPLLVAGSKTRIFSGPFAGMMGTISRVKSGLRVVLTIEAIMRSFSVEVDAAELEPMRS